MICQISQQYASHTNFSQKTTIINQILNSNFFLRKNIIKWGNRTRTSRSEWREEGSGCLRWTSDHFRVTVVPVNMDQRARRVMAAKAHNLYFPLPNTPSNPHPSFWFELLLLLGTTVCPFCPSSSLILQSQKRNNHSEWTKLVQCVNLSFMNYGWVALL